MIRQHHSKGNPKSKIASWFQNWQKWRHSIYSTRLHLLMKDTAAATGGTSGSEMAPVVFIMVFK
jgi:hypothetical protein